jgi:peptidoglycan/LPS O-acetylase OafA/YrhL
MSFDRRYLLWALAYLVIGLGIGIFMAASHRHGQSDTHAHVLLTGFLVSFTYGVIHRLWLAQPNPVIARVQFIAHQAGAVAVSSGLLLLYGPNVVPDERLEPVLGIGSLGVLIGALLMLYMVLRRPAAAS